MNLNLVGVSSVNWRSVPAKELYPGIRIRPLWNGNSASKAVILEIDAGAAFPEVDLHQPGPEEIYVVSGNFGDGVHEYPAGTFVHNPAGSAHLPQSKDGCVLFVFFPDG